MTPNLERRPSFASKAPLARQESRPAVSRRDSTTSHTGGIPPSGSGESWRSHANPLPLPSAPRHGQTRPRKPSLVSSPSIFDQVDSLKEDPDVELEVVDFSDLGKFVGVAEPEPEPELTTAPAPAPTPASEPTPTPEPAPADAPLSSSQPPKTPRPVASDFFEDKVPPLSDQTSSKAVDSIVWRRKEPAPVHVEHVSAPSSRTTLPQPESAHLSPHKLRSQYKEANMSALDDAMSRIKGALDGMHGSDTHSSVVVAVAEPHLSSPASAKHGKERWAPPALRLRHQIDLDMREPFRTIPEPPRSPKPAWNAFTVRLPKISKQVDIVSKRQLSLFSKPSFTRWDVLSFDPPVEGMTRKDFSLNDVLFRAFKPNPAYKGKIRYRVVLPPRPPLVHMASSRSEASKPVGGAFGKPSSANAVSSWRSVAPKASEPPPPPPPPPEPAAILTSPAKTERAKLPKMPVGSSVAFYRDSQVVHVESDSKPSVSFIVTSELEENGKEGQSVNPESHASASNLVNGSAVSSSTSSVAESDKTKTVAELVSPRKQAL